MSGVVQIGANAAQFLDELMRVTHGDVRALARHMHGVRNVGAGSGMESFGNGQDIVLSAVAPTIPRNYLPFPVARVDDVEEDYLECSIYDPVTEYHGATVYVAKPWELRASPFDGETWTYDDGTSIEYTYDAAYPHRKRSADDGADTETQVITPDYVIGGYIRLLSGNTHVDGGDSNPCVWEDLNTAGRCWAKE